MGKTVTESFIECHAEKFDFSPTELLFAVLDAYKTLLRSSTCAEESTFQSRPRSEKNRSSFIKLCSWNPGTSPQR